MSVIRRVNVPLQTAAGIIPYLGAAHHWKEGRSAKSLIDQWWIANDIPPTVRCLLDSADEWRGAKLVDAFAERKTDLGDGRASHSQSDMLAIVSTEAKLGIIVVEAKVDEGFDRTVKTWGGYSDPGKQQRLARLCDTLGLSAPHVGLLRYQLLHRTASAIYEARRYHAQQAVMIVQSWCPMNSSFDDFAALGRTLGIPVNKPGVLSEIIDRNGVSLRLGWSAERAGVAS